MLRFLIFFCIDMNFLHSSFPKGLALSALCNKYKGEEYYNIGSIQILTSAQFVVSINRLFSDLYLLFSSSAVPILPRIGMNSFQSLFTKVLFFFAEGKKCEDNVPNNREDKMHRNCLFSLFVRISDVKRRPGPNINLICNLFLQLFKTPPYYFLSKISIHSQSNEACGGYAGLFWVGLL